MGYSQDAGYIPTDINTIMDLIMAAVNTQFSTTYTTESFLGTNHYKYFYALAQKYQQNEVSTAEIFLKLQGYFDQINARISRPVVTSPGIVERFAVKSDEVPDGYIASVKPMIEADAGKISICVDADDGEHAVGSFEITSYANLVSGTDDIITIDSTDFTAQSGAATPGDATFQAATSNAATAASLALQINSHATISLIVRATAVGAVVKLRAIHGGVAANSIALDYTDNDTNVGATKSATTLLGGVDNADYADEKTAICLLISQITVGGAVTQGSESEAVVLSNGQSFDYKYFLPNRIYPTLRLTVTLSENNQVVIGSPDDTKAKLLLNISQRYRLGRNFEPQRYFSILDAPWAAAVKLEYSFDYDPDDPMSATWSNDIYESNFDDLFMIELANTLLDEE